MTGTLSIHEEPDALVVRAGEVDIARYVFEPEAPAEEAPKPFLHPLRTLSGAPLTVYRPWDHRWHKGLQMTWSHVSGQNFWGGPTFAAGEGYRWRDNLGTIRHDRFSSLDASGPEVRFLEDLSWLSSGGERWIEERRSHRFHSVDPGRGIWCLDFGSELLNVRGSALQFGSPTTHGREAAGYAGFFWRAPRAWTGAAVTTSDGVGADQAMGSRAAWVAVASEHDEVDGGATVIAHAGTSSARVPLRWFLRSEPFAGFAISPSFDEEIVLEPRGSIRLFHRLIFVDHVCDRDESTALAEEFRP